MKNGKVGEGDVFSQEKRLYCLSCIKILTKNYYDYIRDPQSLIRKFNNVSWIAAITIYNITGISEVEPSSD
jgi:hypothetical protein